MFQEMNIDNLKKQIKREVRPSATDVNPDIPVDVSRVIQKATAIRPEARYRNPAELKEAFLQAVYKDTLFEVNREVYAGAIDGVPIVNPLVPLRPMMVAEWDIMRVSRDYIR